MNNFNLKQINDNGQNIILNTDTAKDLKIYYLKDSIIRFGFKSVEIEIDVDEKLNGDEILISSNIVKKLKLPLTVKYNIAVTNNELILGPFIGISLGKNITRLYSSLRMLSNYVKDYDKINGVVFGFTTDCIDKENLEMKGLMYNPERDIWETATLSYPAAILKKRELGQDWREYFTSLYKGKIFNYKHVDKWKAYERLSQFPEIAEILPPTALFNDMDDIFNYLNRYKDIYVKPLAGNRGLGIYNIKKTSDGTIQVKTREKDGNIEWNFTNDKEFTEFMNEKLTARKYIIQQTLELTVDNKTIDFRVGLDKDQSGKWKNNMFVTRISGENSIVSNVASSNGTVSYPIDALKNIYQMKESEAKHYEERLISTGMNIAEKIDKTGVHLGKLALDIAIDNNKKMWLIEVNNKNPNDAIMRLLGDNNKFFEIRLTNMLYAKKLAGFDVESNDYIFKFNNENQEVTDQRIRYHLYISVPGKRLSYRRYVHKSSEKFDVVGKIRKIENKVVEIEVEGNMREVNKFINEIKNGTYSDRIKGMAIQEIPVQNNEQEMVLLPNK